MSENKHSFDLSYPTVVSGAVAAATATALSSRLGLMGSILGAVGASVVTAVVSTSLAGWIEHARGVVVRRRVLPWTRLLVGAGGVALVVAAFPTGTGLLLSGIPHDSVAGRVLAQWGLGS